MFWDAVMEMLTVLGGAGILVAALAYLVRTLITHWMNKDVEKYKANLETEQALAIEKLRLDLRQQALEHEVKYRRNDEKIAEHLNGVYQRLLTFLDRAESYVKIVEWSNEPSKKEKLTLAHESNKEFWDYFLAHRLYIPRSLYERTREFAKELSGIVNDFTRNLRAEEKRHKEVDPDYWSKAFAAVNEKSSDVFSRLVEDFQKRLGIVEELGETKAAEGKATDG